MATAQLQTGYLLGKPLADAGLIPPKTTRLTIDVSVDEVVTATFTTFADQKLIDAVLSHVAEMQRCELLVKPNADGTFTVTRRLIDTDERWCGHCDDYTEQTLKSGEHERDSSGDWQECLRCHWHRIGYGDWQPPFKD